MKNYFNDGYIVASEESYNLLVKIGYQCRGYNPEKDMVFYTNHARFIGRKENFRDKQFYINNGRLSWNKPKEELEDSSILHSDIRMRKEDFVISIKDDNGVVYEFEKPDFECELLKVYGDYMIGATLSETGKTWMEEKWTIAGKSKHHKKWNLTPLKKEWFKDENNFPALVIGSNELFVIDTITSLGILKIESNELRLATKEELNSLYYEGK